MALLDQLGINITAVYLFVIFTLAFIGLRFFVFQAYFDALEEREKRTKGGEDHAKGLLVEAQALKAQYEEKARHISGEVKGIFDAEKATATKEYESIVTAARQNTEKAIEEMRSAVAAEVKKASDKLKQEAPAVSAAITQKMLN